MPKKKSGSEQIGTGIPSDPQDDLPNGNSHHDDDTQPGVVLAHPANRELLAIVGNLSLEAKEHSLKLTTLYEMLREFHAPAPSKWAGQLLDEFERHHERTGENVEALHSFVGGAHPHQR